MIMVVHHEWTIMITCSGHFAWACTVELRWKSNKSLHESWLFYVCHCYATNICTHCYVQHHPGHHDSLELVFNDTEWRHHYAMVAVRIPCPPGRTLHLLLVHGDEPRAFGSLRNWVVPKSGSCTTWYIGVFCINCFWNVSSRCFLTKCLIIVPYFDSQRFLSRHHLLGAHASTKNQLPLGT